MQDSANFSRVCVEGVFLAWKERFFQHVEKTLPKLTDTIVVVSLGQKEELSNHFCIGKPEHYRVIPLGFDLEPFSRRVSNGGQFRRRLGLRGDGIKLVGIIGPLTPIKNHRLFLEAVEVLVKTSPDTRVRFVMVGDGELRKDH